MYCTSTVLANERSRSVQLPGQMDETSTTPIATERRTPEYGNSSWERGKCDDHSTSRDRLGLIARTSSATRALKQAALGTTDYFRSHRCARRSLINI